MSEIEEDAAAGSLTDRLQEARLKTEELVPAGIVGDPLENVSDQVTHWNAELAALARLLHTYTCSEEPKCANSPGSYYDRGLANVILTAGYHTDAEVERLTAQLQAARITIAEAKHYLGTERWDDPNFDPLAILSRAGTPE